MASISSTYRGERGDRRLKAIGLFEDNFVTIVFSLLGTEAISMVSFRRASRKEVKEHEKR
jgi:uncharacterized DUF497 family protein